MLYYFHKFFQWLFGVDVIIDALTDWEDAISEDLDKHDKELESLHLGHEELNNRINHFVPTFPSIENFNSLSKIVEQHDVDLVNIKFTQYEKTADSKK